MTIDDNINNDKFVSHMIDYVLDDHFQVLSLHNSYCFLFKSELCLISIHLISKTQVIKNLDNGENLNKKPFNLIRKRRKKLVSKCKDFLSL